MQNVGVEWQGKGAHLADLLDFARLRPWGEASLQQRLI
jgi:type III restriction enzyme